MYLKELTNEEFDSFKNKCKIESIYQTTEYGLVMNHQDYDTLLLGLIEDENILAATLVLIDKKKKNRFAYAPRGFLIDYSDFNLVKRFSENIKYYLNKLGVISIKISPIIVKNIYDKKLDVNSNNEYYNMIFDNLKSIGYKHTGYNDYFENLKPRFEAIINLDKPYYLVFKNIRKEFRTKIRSSESRGVKIYKGNKDDLNYLYLQTKNKYPRDLNYFIDCYNYFNRTNKIEFYYSKLDTEEYLKFCNRKYIEQERLSNYLSVQVSKKPSEKIVDKKIQADKLLNKYKNELIRATKYLKDYPDGIITSSCLIIKNNNEVYLMMDGFDNKYKFLNSKHLLIWKLCEKYCKEGYKTFNLGGVSNPKLEQNKYQGLIDFKTGFNAHIYEYIGDLELICNNTLYFMYNAKPIKSILKK